MKNSVSRFVLLLALCSVLVSLPEINMAKANGPIYIRSDGTVEGTEKIQRDGNVYTFTDDISTGSYSGGIIFEVGGIIIERDNIVVDGAGYTLQGTGNSYEAGAGIYLLGRSNVTIQNMRIRYYASGIYLVKSSNNNIYGNNIIANAAIGINALNYSSNNTITGNNITNNSYHGICLSQSSNNVFFNNYFISNTQQVYTDGSSNIWDNGVKGNYWNDYLGVDADGDGIGDIACIIDANNIDQYPLMKPVAIPELPDGAGENGTNKREPFPTALVASASVVVVVVVSVGLLVYFNKRRKETGTQA